MNKYLHSKWTSVDKINGWRHYEVNKDLKRRKQLEQLAVCDKNISVFININEILNKEKKMHDWKYASATCIVSLN